MTPLRYLNLVLTLCLWTTTAAGPVFRPVTEARRCVDGAPYLIGTATPVDGGLRMMGTQEETDPSRTGRRAVGVPAEPDGRVPDTTATETAAFVAEWVSGTAPDGMFRLRDRHTGALLCYDTTGPKSGTVLPLYTLPEADVTGTLSARFTLNPTDPRQGLATADRVRYSETAKRIYYVGLDAVTGLFKLYPTTGSRTEVRLYYEVAPPGLVREARTGVLTVTGEWSAADVAARDWNGHTVLDLTGADWPDGAWPAEVRRPLIYLLDRQAEHLPPAWGNVVTLDTATGNGVGQARTPVCWTDEDTVWVRYAFTVPTDGCLRYERTVVADGGYHSLFLPFAPDRITLDGDEVPLTRLRGPVDWCEAGVLLAPPPADVRPEAYRPWLLACEAAPAPLLWAVEGAGQTVRASTEALPAPPDDGAAAQETDVCFGGTLTGVHPEGTVPCYVLNPSGTAFVQLVGAGHLRPFRACLYPAGAVSAPAAAPLCDPSVTPVPVVPRPSVGSPSGVYTLDGCRVKPLSSASSRSGALPRGIYVVDGHKRLVP